MASATSVATPKISFKLSSNDSAVLQALFDKGEVSFPDSSANAASSEHVSPNSQNFKIDESLPPFPRCQIEEKDLKVLKTRQLDIIRRIQQHESPSNDTSDAELESVSISATETQVLTNAIEELSSLIAQYPDYPPLYANKAQALRLLIQSKSRESGNKSDQDAAIFYPENKELATKLLSDLSKAISLASPAISVNNGQESRAVSPSQFSLLSTTYLHRGYLLLKAGKIRKEAEETNTTPDDPKGGPEQLLAINSRDQLEEMASQDFFEAGRYGNEVAKQLSVQTNPYAKMCGAIVKEALKREISEFQS